MRRYILLCAAALSLVLIVAGCEKELNGHARQVNVPENALTVSATITGDSKVDYTDDGEMYVKLTWHLDSSDDTKTDRIFGYYYDKQGQPVSFVYKVLELTDANKKKAVFEFESGTPLVDKDKGRQVYFLSCDNRVPEQFKGDGNFKVGENQDPDPYKGADVVVDLSMQSGNLSSLNETTFICATAVVENHKLELKFENQFSILKFSKISNVSESLKYLCLSGDGLRNRGVIKPYGEETVKSFGLVSDENDEGYIYVEPEATSVVNGAIENQYIIVPAGNNISSLTMTAFDESGRYARKFINHLFLLERSKCYTVSTEIPLQPQSNPAVLPGIFSVGDGMSVQFSRGNLYAYWNNTSAQWFFENNQYDFRNQNYEEQPGVSTQFQSCIDGVTKSLITKGTFGLVGWRWKESTGKSPTNAEALHIIANNPVPQIDMGGTFYDWGISVSDSKKYGDIKWFTLSEAQWKYLFTRELYNGKKAFRKITITGMPTGLAGGRTTFVRGVVLFPDDYRNDPDVVFPDRMISVEDWKAQEELGCVFLPAAGCVRYHNLWAFFSNDYVNAVQPDGAQGSCFYWTSSMVSKETQTTTSPAVSPLRWSTKEWSGGDSDTFREPDKDSIFFYGGFNTSTTPDTDYDWIINSKFTEGEGTSRESCAVRLVTEAAPDENPTIEPIGHLDL
ncbi:MAG: hypothetical protein KBT00_03875 [Bacteroidales bacterium]|nr:hypothetical protein [Candidatus Cacconaster merdequi]